MSAPQLRRPSTLAGIAVLTLLYFAAGKFGLSLAFLHASATPVWPCTGLAVAALLLFGRRLWPGVALGAFLVNLTTAGSPWTSAAIAFGNAVEALLIAAWVQRYARGREAFQRPQDIFAFVILAGLGTAISATIGVTSLALGGYAAWPNYAPIWITWWFGDVISAIMWTPLFLLWISTPVRRVPVSCWVEALGLLGAAAVVGQLVFGVGSPVSARHYPVTFLYLPVLVWAAFRFGRRGAITVVFILSGMALRGTLHGVGLFALLGHNESLLVLQAFMATITLTVLVLASLVAEQQRAAQAVHASLQEKEILLKEIHHRVKNNLQTIASLLNLQLGSSREEGTLQALRDSQSRIKAIALVHEKLYQSTSLSSIDLGHYVRDLTQQVQSLVGRPGAVEFEVHAEDIHLGIDAAIPCGLMLHEMLTNAVKHAFPDGRTGRVAVRLAWEREGVWRLVVQDNGVGLPPEVDFKHATSLGLQLIRMLAEQIHGTVELTRDGGTTFSICVKRV